MSEHGRSRRAGLRADLVLVSVLAALPVVLESAAGLVRAGTDLGTFFLPLWSWWWQSPRWLGGWNEWLFAGFPGHADPQLAVTHPFTLLYGVLPPLVASAVEGVLSPALAACGLLLLLRRGGCGRAASVVGALSYALGGAMAAHVPHPSIVRCQMLLPWALLAVDALEGRALAAGLGLVLGGMLLAGQPQVSALSILLLGLYALRFGRALARDRFVALGGAVVLGVLLAASLLLPAAQLVAASMRAVRAPVFPNPTLDASALVQLAVPFAGGGGAGPFGGPARGAFACGLIECTGYPGTLVWIAAAALLPVVLRDARARFWGVVGVFAVVASTGVLPLPQGFRGPARILVWWNLAAAIVGAFAVDALRSDRRRIALAVAAWLGLLLVVALRVPAARGAVAGAALAAAVTSAALLLVAWRSWSAWWLVAALTADLLLFDATLLSGGVRPEALHALRAPVERLERLRDDPACAVGTHGRILVLDPPFALQGIDWAAVGRVATVQGYDPLVLQPLAGLLQQTGPSGFEAVGYVASASLAADTDSALDLLRVGTVVRDPARGNPLGEAIAAAARRGDARWERLTECGADGAEVYRNRRVRPVAWLVPEAIVVPSRERAVARVHGAEGGLQPERAVLLDPGAEAGPVAERAAAAGSVAVLAYGGDAIELALDAQGAGWLVTSELAFPGWTALVDDVPTAVESANGGFRAVRVPRGARRVRFAYRPRAVRTGMALSALGVLAVVLLAVPARRRPPVP